MSTTTETKNDFAESTVENAETVETVQQDGSTTTVTQETTSDQHEHHHHTNEDGTLSPLCSGGGCPDGTVK